MFSIYKGSGASLQSFCAQLEENLSFAAEQEPFHAATEEDIWQEVSDNLLTAESVL